MFGGQDTPAPTEPPSACQLTQPSETAAQLRRWTGSCRSHRNGRPATGRPATGPVAPSIPCCDMPRRRGPHRVAVVDAVSSHTYAELDELVDRAAGGFAALGIAPADRVLLQLPNSCRFAVALFGLLRAGAIPVMCLPGHRLAELSHFAAGQRRGRADHRRDGERFRLPRRWPNSWSRRIRSCATSSSTGTPAPSCRGRRCPPATRLRSCARHRRPRAAAGVGWHHRRAEADPSHPR